MGWEDLGCCCPPACRYDDQARPTGRFSKTAFFRGRSLITSSSKHQYSVQSTAATVTTTTATTPTKYYCYDYDYPCYYYFFYYY